MQERPIELQTADAIAALAIALCQQSNIDGQQLHRDFLANLSQVHGDTENIGSVVQRIASMMKEASQAV